MKLTTFIFLKISALGLLFAFNSYWYILYGIYQYVVNMMNLQTAKVFLNGRSQAVRLPKEFRFNSLEVYIRKVGNAVVIYEKKPSWVGFFGRPSSFSHDFLNNRDNAVPQERDFY